MMGNKAWRTGESWPQHIYPLPRHCALLERQTFPSLAQPVAVTLTGITGERGRSQTCAMKLPSDLLLLTRHTHTEIHTYTHTYKGIETYKHTQIRIHIDTQRNTHTQACTHTHTCTQTHTNAETHTHRHTRLCTPLLFR